MPRGRPREFDRDAALDIAMDLFWRQGYAATSLDDLLSAISIGRGSFYAAFGGKGELFREVIRRYRIKTSEELGHALLSAPSGMAFIESILSIPLLEAEGKKPALGCLILNTVGELGGRETGFGWDLQESLRVFEQIFQHAILRAQYEGSVAPSVSPEALATFLSASLGGLRLLAKTGAPTEKIQAAIPPILKVFTS